MENVTAVAVLIAVIKTVKSYVPQVHDGTTVLLAAALGWGAGWLGLLGLNVETGIISGLSAVGIHVALKAVGGK